MLMSRTATVRDLTVKAISKNSSTASSFCQGKWQVVEADHTFLRHYWRLRAVNLEVVGLDDEYR
jgi:hypothetical protein